MSESVSILDRLQGTSAANNFSKDEESNAFLPKKQLFDKQLPALDKTDLNETAWAPTTEQMKSVQTPRSGLNLPYPDSKSHQSMSLAQKSANIADNDPRRIQMSVESKKSSKNELTGDAVSQSSSSVFDRNAFQQFASSQRDKVMQNADY